MPDIRDAINDPLLGLDDLAPIESGSLEMLDQDIEFEDIDDSP